MDLGPLNKIWEDLIKKLGEMVEADELKRYIDERWWVMTIIDLKIEDLVRHHVSGKSHERPGVQIMEIRPLPGIPDLNN